MLLQIVRSVALFIVFHLSSLQIYKGIPFLFIFIFSLLNLFLSPHNILMNTCVGPQQGKIQHASSRTSSSASNLYRQNLSRSSAHASTPRVTQARFPTSTRMTRPRGRLPGQPRTISSRQSYSPVPPIMDGTRMLFDIGMAGGFIQSEHDFNEVLLALHNNRQHGGASAAQIHGSPGSKVQVLLEGYGGAYTSTLKKNQDKAIILHMLVNKRMMATLGLTPRLQLL